MFITRHKTSFRILCIVLFVLYVIALIYFLFFAEMLGRTDHSDVYHYNLMLFKEIRRFWVYRRQLGLTVVFLNLAGNVLIFAPFGFLLPALFRKVRTFGKVVILSIFLSLLVESVQLVTKTGSFDVDDLFLNVLGGMLGYLVYRIVQKSRDWSVDRFRKKMQEEMNGK